MKLYHNPLSSCSQKVRLVLAEKQLQWDSIELNLQRGDQFAPDYLQLNPRAVVPTLEDEGQVYIESSLINEYLEDGYPGTSLRPANAVERYRMNTHVKIIDDTQHPACSVITYAIGLRPLILQNSTPAQLAKMLDAIPDAARRESRRAVLHDGIDAPVFREAYQSYVGVLKNADATLRNSTWLAGDSFSLADCAYLPYVLRLEHLGQKAFIDTLPGLSRWYRAVQARPSFQQAITQWQQGPVVENMLREGAQVADRVAQLH